MRTLTNKQLADLKEKWIFYCNHSAKEVYKCGFRIPPVIKEIQEENELILRLINYTIQRKSADKKRRKKHD